MISFANFSVTINEFWKYFKRSQLIKSASFLFGSLKFLPSVFILDMLACFKYVVFSYSHVNMKTQYDKPKFQNHYDGDDESYLDHSQPPAYNHVEYQKYIIEDRHFEGELIRTTLFKGSRGFGFTIIGGDEPGELLQIKSIVPDGAAAKDGRLRVGDALVRLNGRPVVHKTHQEVVSMFQQMPPSEDVEMEMIRGYPLPFDPDDPNVETIGSYTVVRSPTHGPESLGGYNHDGLAPPASKFNFSKSASDQSLTSSTASAGRHQGKKKYIKEKQK